jgi:hypothetical protein
VALSPAPSVDAQGAVATGAAIQLSNPATGLVRKTNVSISSGSFGLISRDVAALRA